MSRQKNSILINKHALNREPVPLIIVDNVYRGFSFIVCLTIIVTLILIATFWPHTAGLHQTIMLTYWGKLFVPPWLWLWLISDWCITNLAHGWWVLIQRIVGIVRGRNCDPSAVHCGRGRMSCCRIVGIHASGISIPLSLLMLLG